MIKRYGHIPGYDDIDETPDGEFVLLTDYEELQRQLAEERAARYRDLFDLEQERARLDYLERSACDVGRVMVVPEIAYSKELTLREALDAERKAT